MPFFARPNLDNTQFKQLSGSTLTLEGQTQIATTTGFTLSDGLGGNVVVTAEGATGITAIGQVLTFDGSKIRLMDSAASGGTSMYNPPYKSPSTCTVGGLVAGTTLTGKTLSCILQDILVPTIQPTVTPPSQCAFTVGIVPNQLIYEVGTSVVVTLTSCFSQGCINPLYQGVPPFSAVPRSGLPMAYEYSSYWCGPATALSTALSDVCIFPSHVINAGTNNNFSVYIKYSSGATCVYNSACIGYLPPLPSGCSNTCSCTITGIYPYYYGKFCCVSAPAGSCRPTADCIKTIITGGTVTGTNTCQKIVDDSNNTLSIQFCSTPDDYLWFAIPNACTPKTKWYVDALNNGNIGGAVSAGGNLFPLFDTRTNVKSNSGCWSGQTYQIYISNYQTTTKCCGGTCCYIMELRNN